MTPWFDYPTFTWADRHAIVVGAGIAGCQMTWHLSQLGWRVTLIEQETTISRQASGNLAGVISPKMTAQDTAAERFYRAAFQYAQTQLKQFGWQACGMLQLAHNDREQQRWLSLKQRELDNHLIQLLDANDTSNMAGFTCDYASSFFPGAGFINPSSYCHDLLTDSHHTLITSRQITQLQRDRQSEQWVASDDTGRSIEQAPVVVLCQGAEMTSLIDGHAFPQMPVLGQTTHLAASQLDHDVQCVIGHEGYLTPATQGSHVFGATFDRDFEDITVKSEADQRNLAQLTRYVPTIGETVQSVDSGHAACRATTPDRYPYAGALPDISYYKRSYQALKHGRRSQHFPSAQYQQGLFILGGFGSRGLTTSGYCANALAHLIHPAGPQSKVAANQSLLTTLHPARFLIRQLKRGSI